MDKIKSIFRISVEWLFLPLTIWYGSRRLNKWMKKIRREQDPSLHPFDERWEYIRKKMKSFRRYTGIRVEVEGMENLPKGAAWITPNHTSNFDAFYLISALGGKTQLVPVARDTLKNNKMAKGYFAASDTMFLERKSPRQALTLLDGAARYAKTNNRAIVIFPEGTRSLNTELLDFKAAQFKFAQKYFIPIVPVTITGTMQARKIFALKTRTVTVTVHKPIKAIEHSKLPTDIIARRVKDTIQGRLDQYQNSLNQDELKELNQLKEDVKKAIAKKDARVEKELRG